jgi:hypothetical protein
LNETRLPSVSGASTGVSLETAAVPVAEAMIDEAFTFVAYASSGRVLDAFKAVEDVIRLDDADEVVEVIEEVERSVDVEVVVLEVVGA